MTAPTQEQVEDDMKDSMTTCELRGPRLVGPHGGLREKMPSPEDADLADPLFEAIWQATKTWDVNVPEKYAGYCGMNGSHVMLILEPIRAALAFAAGARSGEDARDAARLDWLDQQDGAISHIQYGDYRHYFGDPFKPARAVIDAAMGGNDA